MKPLVRETGTGRKSGSVQTRSKSGRFGSHLAGMTEKQASFVENVVCYGMKQTPAAAAAGYANAKDAGYTLVRTPHVAKAIQEFQRRELDVNLANMALDGLRSILSMKDQLLQSAAGTKIYLDACVKVLDRSLCGAKREENEDFGQKPPSDMSIDELQAELRMMMARLDFEDAAEAEEETENGENARDSEGDNEPQVNMDETSGSEEVCDGENSASLLPVLNVGRNLFAVRG